MIDRGFFLRIMFCIFAFGLCLYSYIDKQNALTRDRIRIPSLVKEIKAIREENTRLQYEIDRFESPEHLMELARHSEFGHLKHPMRREILTISKGIAMQASSKDSKEISKVRPKIPLAIGAKQ